MHVLCVQFGHVTCKQVHYNKIGVRYDSYSCCTAYNVYQVVLDKELNIFLLVLVCLSVYRVSLYLNCHNSSRALQRHGKQYSFKLVSEDNMVAKGSQT